MNLQKVKSYVVINVETTGIDENKDEIICLSAQKVIDDMLVFDYLSFVKSRKNLTEEAKRLLNLSDAEKELFNNALCIEEVIDNFLDYIKDEVIIGYNLDFNLRFINKYLELNNKGSIKGDIDIYDFVKEKLYNLPNYSFNTVCKALKINKPRNIQEETKAMAQAYQILRDKKYNAVFLDIDGVINNENTPNNMDAQVRIDSSLLEKFAEFAKWNDLAIILVSDWKDYWEKDKSKQSKIGEYLDYRFSCEELKIADKIKGSSFIRGKNIKNYLLEHKDLDKFVILDDIEFDYEDEGLSKNFIQTDSKKGLTAEDIEKASKILYGSGKRL